MQHIDINHSKRWLQILSPMCFCLLDQGTMVFNFICVLSADCWLRQTVIWNPVMNIYNYFLSSLSLKILLIRTWHFQNCETNGSIVSVYRSPKLKSVTELTYFSSSKNRYSIKTWQMNKGEKGSACIYCLFNEMNEICISVLFNNNS